MTDLQPIIAEAKVATISFKSDESTNGVGFKLYFRISGER